MRNNGDNGALPQRNLARHLLSGAAWAFLVRCFGAGSAMVANAALARLLNPDELGHYFLLQSIAVFAAITARFGLKQTVVRLVAESTAKNLGGRARQGLNIVYGIVFFCSIAVGIIYFFLLSRWLSGTVFDSDAISIAAGATVGWIILLAFQTPVAETFRGLHDIRLATLLDGALANFLLATALSILWAIHFPISLPDSISITAIAVGFSVFFGSLLMMNRVRDFGSNGTASVREVLFISAPILIIDLATQAMTNLTLWIVGAYVPADEVALYGAAWKLVILVILPLTLVNMTVQPVISELYIRRENRKLEMALRGMATLAGVPAFVVLLTFMLFGTFVLETIYGPHYGDAATLLSILSIGMLFDVWSGSCTQVLIYTGHQRTLMHVTLLTGAISAALATIATAKFGVYGAATAVTVGKVFQNGACWLLVRQRIGIWTHVTLSPSLLRLGMQRLRK